jgi:hypothetical protein
MDLLALLHGIAIEVGGAAPRLPRADSNSAAEFSGGEHGNSPGSVGGGCGSRRRSTRAPSMAFRLVPLPVVRIEGTGRVVARREKGCTTSRTFRRDNFMDAHVCVSAKARRPQFFGGSATELAGQGRNRHSDRHFPGWRRLLPAASGVSEALAASSLTVRDSSSATSARSRRSAATKGRRRAASSWLRVLVTWRPPSWCIHVA